MVFNAVSLHQGGVLSGEAFLQAMGRPGEHAAADGTAANPFAGVETLPTFDEALELLLDEALQRSGGNQTVAARLLGVSQPALSKRLKARQR